ncbi:MAG: UTP--glucose-1-phosphate uridylyltransferase, partial [Oscillospiraceae bacterium]|nr:UTP--glucose-1-phosphate uridylyltransferase [Oscillospiraceae bacterium]
QLVSDEAIPKYCSLKIEELEDRIYRVFDVIEKPPIEKKFSNYAILGRYVLTSEIFSILENTPPGHGDEIQLTDGLCELCKISTMVAVDFDAKRYDTGNLPGFLEATIEFALRHPEAGPWLKRYLAELKL